MKIFIPLFILIFAAAAFAQSDLPEMSTVAEIREKTKFYLDADADNRKWILKALKHVKANLVLVNKPEDAEFFIQYRDLSRQDVKELIGSAYTERGQMDVYFYRDKRKIIAWSQVESYYASSGMSFESPNPWVLAKKFVKALKKE